MKSVLDKAEKEEGERDKVLSLLQSVKCSNREIQHIVHVIKYKERLVFQYHAIFNFRNGSLML